METATAGLRDGGRLKDIDAFIHGLYGPDLHTKRVESLAAATLGVMTGASLAVAMIGQALAQARGLVTKHAIKQVDRLLSNKGIDVWDSFARWVPHVQHGGKRQWITLETGTLSRFKPAPHHARKRQWITQQTGTSGRGESAPASGRGSLLAGE